MNLATGEAIFMEMVVTARVDGQDKVITIVQQIVKSLATSKHTAEDMIHILFGFDNHLLTMINLFPATGYNCSSSTIGGSQWPKPERSGDPHLDAVEEIIMRWESLDFLLWESHAKESFEYLGAVDELISILELGTCPNKLQSRAEIALKVSMERLEEEFHHPMIRSTILLNVDGLYSLINRDSLSFPYYSSDLIEGDFDGSAEEKQQPEASMDERVVNSFSNYRKIDLVLPKAFSHLKEIADRMLRSGYGKELCQVYSSVRRDILDEFLLILGFEWISIEEVQRFEWKALNEKMGKWIQAMGVIVRILLMEEKRLCEKIFAASEEFTEECFVVATKGCIMKIFYFGDAISLC